MCLGNGHYLCVSQRLEQLPRIGINAIESPGANIVSLIYLSITLSWAWISGQHLITTNQDRRCLLLYQSGLEIGTVSQSRILAGEEIYLPELWGQVRLQALFRSPLELEHLPEGHARCHDTEMYFFSMFLAEIWIKNLEEYEDDRMLKKFRWVISEGNAAARTCIAKDMPVSLE